MALLAASLERFKPGQWFEGWILERVRVRRGTVLLPFTLEYRHIYVMPTRFGAWFGLLLAVTIVGGLNFNNNMALLFGFILAAIAQLTSFLAYRNLVGLTLSSIQVQPVFAGDAACFRIFLNNPEPRHRYAVQLSSAESADTLDIDPNRSAGSLLQQQTGVRGWMQLDAFYLESRIPLGLFRAWSVIIPATRCLVYPQPASNPPPLPRAGRGEDGMARVGEGEQFHGLREYRPGDPLRSVAWRTSARHDKLYSQVMESPREEACELNWYLMGGLEVEEKLSILTAWILRAERRQIPYSLELPTDALPAGLGEEHRDACLKILALHGT
jgi:uncharacterized protein (DUF58 family)